MNTIGSKFFVTCLEDGTTLHGNLSVDGSLSQAYNAASGGCVPSWATSSGVCKNAQPTITLTVLSGNTYIGVDVSNTGYIDKANSYWTYNGTALTFSTTQTTYQDEDGNDVKGYLCTTQGYEGMFMYQEKEIVADIKVPCLRIIQNLASSTNVDLDTIAYVGKYKTGANGASVDFNASAQVRISLMSQGGYVGLINFTNGVSDITNKDDVIEMTGVLYDENSAIVSNIQVKWYLNEAPFKPNAQTGYGANPTTVSASDVVDNAIVRCDFYKTGDTEVKASAYASIDDMQDSEFMYIQYNDANGNAASLRKGGSVEFVIWVGRNNDPAVDTSYTHYQVKFIDGSGNVITGTMANINNCISTDPTSADYGWRNIFLDNNAGQAGAHNPLTHKAYLTIVYQVVLDNGKNITGLVRAYTD